MPWAGNQRVTAGLRRHDDDGGRTVARQVWRTWWRDLPVTVGFWLYIVAGIGSVWTLTTVFDVGQRVFFAGALLPVYWVAGALLNAYIRAAATLPMDARRSDVVDETIRLGLIHPIRTLLSVALVLATAPVWVLPRSRWPAASACRPGRSAACGVCG